VKRAALFLHRWIGLIVGIIVLIEGVTGSIYCFHDEIKDMLHQSYRKVEARAAEQYILPSALINHVKNREPDLTISRIMYMGPERSVTVTAKSADGATRAFYFNPYDGRLLHTTDLDADFFSMVLDLHMYLLLPPKIGKTVIGIANVSFLIIVLTGIIAWWPKRRQDRKRVFRIKWGAKWKRLNYDLHQVLGFYASLTALLLIFTGMVFSFDVVKRSVFQIVNAGKGDLAELSFLPPARTDTTAGDLGQRIDRAYTYVQGPQPVKSMMWLYAPSATLVSIRVRNYPVPLYFDRSDEYTFDLQGYGVNPRRYKDMSPGKKVVMANYDVHTGQYFGLIGKVILFITSLIIASLPLTGMIIWLSKKRKKNKSNTPKGLLRSPIKQSMHQ